jgi:cell division protein FtsI/penicillin-binding protein 2
MGSIIKPITVAIGLERGAVSETTTYTDTGTIERSGYTIGNYDGRARGTVVLQEILSQSLNTGAAFVAEEVGRESFIQGLERFAINQETGIDLPYETVGSIESLKSKAAIDLVTASFGQGIALTPIATIRALSALGNGGLLPEPHVVKEIRYNNGVVRPITHAVTERALSQETSRRITDMLVKVVDGPLAGGKVTMEKYAIAAKTGTAQIGEADGSGYKDDVYNHVFFGYFPAYKPEFLIYIFLEEPQGVKYASETLAIPFKELVEFLISYYRIPPDR